MNLSEEFRFMLVVIKLKGYVVWVSENTKYDSFYIASSYLRYLVDLL